MGADIHAASRALYRVAALPLVAYPLLLCWRRGWLPTPQGEAVARLDGGRALMCKLSDGTQRTMYLGLFEPDETRLVSRLLGPGDTFIDVGAHIGWFTTLAAVAVGANGQVIACEPYPANVAGLRRNLALNDGRNVRVVEAALGSQSGSLGLATSGDSGDVTALDWASRGRVEVPMRTLDEIAPDGAEIALVKMDVEGWEANVLRGAANALTRTRHVIIEINPPALARAGSSQEELFELLRSSGFSSFVPVARTGLRRLNRGSVVNVLATRGDRTGHDPAAPAAS